MIDSAGASRMSSVPGLNARPHSAIVLPASDAAEVRDDLVGEHALLPLVDPVHRLEDLERRGRASRAVAITALTSFGKHEPP